MKQDLSKEVVVITGAASGIGRALLKKYLQAGAKVAALDVNEEALQELKTAHLEDAARIFNQVVDVSDEAEVIAAGQQIFSKFGKPSVWINNAGIALLGDFEKVATTDFARVMSINFDGVVYGTRVALSLMKEPERGSIVNIASVSGTVAAPFMTSYTAAKHAVVGFTRALREEREQSHSAIKIILVSPGLVRTKIMEVSEEFRLPQWLQWIVHDPDSTAEEIVAGIQSGRVEILPTINGKMLLALHRVAPGITRKSSRLVSAKSWKELLGLSPIRK